jgi:Fic family protein
VAQTKVIDEACKESHNYVDRKTAELLESESNIRALNLFNHRQVAIIRHALKHHYQQYTVEGHRNSHNIVYETARTDLLDLQKREVLELRKKGKQMVFTVPNDLAGILKKMGKKTAKSE